MQYDSATLIILKEVGRFCMFHSNVCQRCCPRQVPKPFLLWFVCRRIARDVCNLPRLTIPVKQPSKHQHHLPHLRSNDPTRVPTAYSATEPWMEALLCCSVSWAPWRVALRIVCSCWQSWLWLCHTTYTNHPISSIVTLFHLRVIAGIADYCLFVSYHFWKTLLKLLSSCAVTWSEPMDSI